MTLQELQIQILDEIDIVIHEPVVNPEEVRRNVQEAFRQYEAEAQAEEAPIL